MELQNNRKVLKRGFTYFLATVISILFLLLSLKTNSIGIDIVDYLLYGVGYISIFSIICLIFLWYKWVDKAVIGVDESIHTYDDREIIGHHYETTIRSDGVFETRKVEEYRDDDFYGCIGKVLMVVILLFGIVWGPIALLVMALNYYKQRASVPKAFMRAYNRTQKQVKRLGRSEKKKLYSAKKAYKEGSRELRKKREKIYKKHAYADKATLKAHLDRITEAPKPTVKIHSRKYVFYEEKNGNYLLASDQRCGQSAMRILLASGYFLYGNGESWQADWKIISED